MAEITEVQNQQDLELKKQLETRDWKRYLVYGTIKVQIRSGKKTLTTVERTYPD